MKVKTITLLAFLALSTSSLFAQITINRSDFLMQTTQSDTALLLSSVNFPVPTSGVNQFWDYSSYTVFTGAFQYDFNTANNPSFPTANQERVGNFTFQGNFPIIATDLLRLDSTSYTEIGLETQYAAFSIANLTGGPTDSLYFLQDNQYFNVPDTLIKFPMNYLDSTQSLPLDTTNMEITVAGFGLNKAPAQIIKDIMVDYKIIGSGRLVIPQFGGGFSDTMDVLLSRRIRTRVDSIFLNGNPAPAALTSAFGLSQGQTFIDTIYQFYRKGFKNTVAQIEYGTNNNVRFFHGVNRNITSIRENGTAKTLKGFPNPINKGEFYQFEAMDNFKNGAISLLDITGKVVTREFVRNSIGIQIPNSIKPGLYFVELVDFDKNERFTNKLIVR